MNSTEKSKKNVEKLINNDKEKNINEKIINNLNKIEESFEVVNNNNRFINSIHKNNDSKNSHSYESNNKIKNEKDNLNMGVNLDKNKSREQINNLINDGIISRRSCSIYSGVVARSAAACSTDRPDLSRLSRSSLSVS